MFNANYLQMKKQIGKLLLFFGLLALLLSSHIVAIVPTEWLVARAFQKISAEEVRADVNGVPVLLNQEGIFLGLEGKERKVIDFSGIATMLPEKSTGSIDETAWKELWEFRGGEFTFVERAGKNRKFWKIAGGFGNLLGKVDLYFGLNGDLERIFFGEGDWVMDIWLEDKKTKKISHNHTKYGILKEN